MKYNDPNLSYFIFTEKDVTEILRKNGKFIKKYIKYSTNYFFCSININLNKYHCRDTHNLKKIIV